MKKPSRFSLLGVPRPSAVHPHSGDQLGPLRPPRILSRNPDRGKMVIHSGPAIRLALDEQDPPRLAYLPQAFQPVRRDLVSGPPSEAPRLLHLQPVAARYFLSGLAVVGNEHGGLAREFAVGNAQPHKEVQRELLGLRQGGLGTARSPGRLGGGHDAAARGSRRRSFHACPNRRQIDRQPSRQGREADGHLLGLRASTRPAWMNASISRGSNITRLPSLMYESRPCRSQLLRVNLEMPIIPAPARTLTRVVVRPGPIRLLLTHIIS